MRYDGPCKKTRKPLLVTEHPQGFGRLLNSLCLVQELQELSINAPGKSRAKREIHLLSSGQRYATALPGLSRISQHPQDTSQTGENDDTEIHPVGMHGSALLPRVTEGNPLF